MRRRSLAVTGLLLLLPACVFVYADNAQKAVLDLLATRKYSTNGIGIVVRDIEKDSTIVAINPDEKYNPASVSKLVTAAAAFELLGPNYSFQTKVFTQGEFNRSTGTLNGNLFIRGGGDPGFTAERLWLLVQHLYHLGIRKVQGDLVLDDTYFDSVTIGPGFDEDSSSRAYQPLISPLSASFSTVAVHHRPGNVVGDPVVIDLFPKIKDIEIISSAKTTAAGKPGQLDISTIVKNNKSCILVKGNQAMDETPDYTYRKLWQTWESFGGALQSYFGESGIQLIGTLRHCRVPDSLLSKRPFYLFTSEPLSQSVQNMFKYSSNFASEMVLKTMAAQMCSEPGTWENGSATLLRWWKDKGLPGTPQLKNGSGLGNSNRLCASQLTALLAHVWNEKSYLPEYLACLSTSGVDGTLKSRFKNSPLKGIIRGKTGTLNSYGVSTLSGFVLLPGKTYAFAIICNGAGAGQYDNWMIQEQIIEKAVECSYGKIVKK